MKKGILLIIALLLMTSGCAVFGTMFSKSRTNFDEKIDRIDAYLKTQGYKLTEYAGLSDSDKNYFDVGNEQFIIEYVNPDESYILPLESIRTLAIQNNIIMGANIMGNKINKGKMYLTLEVALSKDDEKSTHIDNVGVKIREFTLTYDGKPIVLSSKKDYGSYLYGNQQFIYSDIKIFKQLANAKEIVIEGRSSAGRKYSKTLKGEDLKLFKKTLQVVEEVHSILNN